MTQYINARYGNVENTTILAETDGVTLSIPVAPGNRDYDYIVSNNISIADYIPPPVPVPTTVTMRQARIALSRSGHLSQVESALAEMEGQEGEEARIEWEYATTFDRSHPLVIGLASSLELTEQDLDDLFTLASTV
jgi:hypothetical protein